MKINNFALIEIGREKGASALYSSGLTDKVLRELLIEENTGIFDPIDIYNIHYDSVDTFRRTIVEIGLYIRDNNNIDLSESALKALELLENWFNNNAQCKTTELQEDR